MDIDLSSPKYYSDGEGDQPPDDLLPHSKRAPDDIFLTHLNEVYNRYVDKGSFPPFLTNFSVANPKPFSLQTNT